MIVFTDFTDKSSGISVNTSARGTIVAVDENLAPQHDTVYGVTWQPVIVTFHGWISLSQKKKVAKPKKPS